MLCLTSDAPPPLGVFLGGRSTCAQTHSLRAGWGPSDTNRHVLLQAMPCRWWGSLPSPGPSHGEGAPRHRGPPRKSPRRWQIDARTNGPDSIARYIRQNRTKLVDLGPTSVEFASGANRVKLNQFCLFEVEFGEHRPNSIEIDPTWPRTANLDRKWHPPQVAYIWLGFDVRSKSPRNRRRRAKSCHDRPCIA